MVLRPTAPRKIMTLNVITTAFFLLLPTTCFTFLPENVCSQHRSVVQTFREQNRPNFGPKQTFLSMNIGETDPSAYFPFDSSFVHLETAQHTLASVQGIDIHPSIEEEFLDIISHTVDLVTFLSPDAASLPIFDMVNRLLELAGHYSDGYIPPEEAIFQVAMLGLSAKAFLKSVSPVLLALFASASFRDHKAYEILFAATSLSWIQFKTIFVAAVDWIEVEPQTLINAGEDEDKYIYWLYQGDIDVTLDGSTVYHVASEPENPNFHDKHGIGLLGEMEFAHKLEIMKMGGFNMHKSANHASYTLDLYRRTITKTGEKGATLLRINTSKLLELMETDHHLADAMYSLLFNGMQEKLSILLERAIDLEFRNNHKPFAA